MALDCATESPANYTVHTMRFGQQSEDKLAVLHLWLGHGDECES